MKRWMAAAMAAVLALGMAAPAHAQFGAGEATAVREDFVLPQGEVRILVFRPEIRVGAQTMGGMHEPNAEWTETAKGHIMAALEAEQAARGTSLVIVPELEGEQGELVADYTALFQTVAGEAFQHKLFPGNRLPSKRHDFDWTLGAETEQLRALGGDYGLFLVTNDSYGSTGRKVLQVLGAVAGVGLVPSGVHMGYAGLVDLRTGHLVWLNGDLQMGGDVRTAEGAQKRVAQLLEEFPLRATGQPAPERAREVTVTGETPAEPKP